MPLPPRKQPPPQDMSTPGYVRGPGYGSESIWPKTVDPFAQSSIPVARKLLYGWVLAAVVVGIPATLVYYSVRAMIDITSYEAAKSNQGGRR